MQPGTRYELPALGPGGEPLQPDSELGLVTELTAGWARQLAQFTWCALGGQGREFWAGGWAVLALFVLAECAVITAVVWFGAETGADSTVGALGEAPPPAAWAVVDGEVCRLSLYLAEMLEDQNL